MWISERHRVVKWLFARYSVDPVDRVIEPLVRTAMVASVFASLVSIWIGWATSLNGPAYLEYALRTTPVQLLGILGALLMLNRRGPRVAARLFVLTPVLVVSVTSYTQGAMLVSNGLPRLFMPIIVTALSLGTLESGLWTGALIAAAWVGVLAPSFEALGTPDRLQTLSRLSAGSVVLVAGSFVLGILRRSLRASILESNARAEQLARAQRIDSLGRLAAGAAHDFNGLLGSILLSVDEARNGESAQEREDALTLIERTVRQSRDLTQRLLQLGRGEAAVPSGHFDLRRAVLDAVGAVQPLFGPQVPLTHDLSDREVPIVGSLVEIRQVVTNLLINARQAVGTNGRVAVTITIEDPPTRAPQGSSGGRARLRVTDNGPGVPEAVREKLFEPFVTTKSAGLGSGLGLSTSQVIAFRHQGTLALEPQGTTGASFVLTLPLAETPSLSSS